MAFVVQAGGNTVSPRELTLVSDSAEKVRPTHLQPERRRV
ncbi:hypothetical protein CRN15_01865 [Raoultella planticola]|nr:hypothetical protein CRT62_05750 [Raoultella planticola]ATM13684.1 hypothetical protein CRN15_01865 [Raoultella planticola]OZP75274.1 hypothetical protein CIG23_00125 [Raoultella planticola]PHH26370.1 hypothetical protein CRX55_21050 [Raoultella planticola]PIM83547.1 hypothetical protein CT151_17615 [Raoultella planticola]